MGRMTAARQTAMAPNLASRPFSSSSDAARDRRYHWVEPEAERLIARAYARHRQLAQRDAVSPNGWKSFPPSISIADLESPALEQEYHYPPKTRGDRIAKKLVDYGEKLMHLFFREKVRREEGGVNAPAPAQSPALSFFRAPMRDH